MNARLLLMIGVLFGLVLAEGEQTFQYYGFADMTITKYFPKENSLVRNVPKMDENLMFSFDHFNVYGDFRPNDRLRFLSELSYQDRPVYDQDKNGMKMVIPGVPETIFNTPDSGRTNQTMKGIVRYDWGSFSVERALMSVRLNRFWNLSFGKFITPAGIWNVDHGSPVIMTINQPSQYSYREIYPKSQLGVMESGRTYLGNTELSYSAYISSGRGNPSIRELKAIATGGQVRVGVPLLDECNLGLSWYTGETNVVQRWLIMSPTDMTFANWKYSIWDDKLFEYREEVGGMDFKLRKSIFSLQAEYNYMRAANKMKHDSLTSIMGTYLLGSVDAYKGNNFKLTPYGYWELVTFTKPKNNQSLFNGTVRESTAPEVMTMAALGYMKFFGGVNMRLFTNMGIKVEYNFTRLYFADAKDPNKNAEDKDRLMDIPGLATQFYLAF